MGAWGTSLYSNDTTCDIRGDYVDKLKRGKTNEEVTAELIESNCDIMGDDEEEPLFWYALADTQWNYGRLMPEVKEKALYFLSQTAELERWRESGEKQLAKWENTLSKLKNKLETPQPPIKKVSKYRLYQCKWQLGDVFAYRFTSDYSAEEGYFGKYVVFRKVSEDTWWPGHIVPVIQIYKKIFDNVPLLDEINGIELLPTLFNTKINNVSDGQKYNMKLIVESERKIPTDNLAYIGNLPGKDIFPFPGSGYWSGYVPVGWESSSYNIKFEHHVIEMFSIWG